MTAILSTREIIYCATLGIPKGIKKNVISISSAFGIDILIIQIPKNKKSFEIILHVQ